ncbi:MAG: MBL fold metallo-hydrolase [Acidimicrobiia bacterium]|nr:MBL fold metallo-hydrolase [Acidimicrobiia bacterium]
MQITVLGSGTSVGVPTIGCHCKVCTSTDPRDNRLRPSVLVRYGGKSILIDTTPDFRQQALRARIERVDAILFTHWHADHIMGLDDVRPFNFRQKEPIPIYGSERTVEAVLTCFRYAFSESTGQTNIPRLQPKVLNSGPFELFGTEVHPVPLLHGRDEIYGFRFPGFAYLTDHSEIPEQSMGMLEGLDVLFLDALRHKPHPTHSTVERSLKHVERLGPRRAYFTHVCHDLAHEETENRLPEHVRLAYDGLEITVDG